MSFPDDAGIVRVAGAFGIEPEALLGYGGEAFVYALDADRIVRIHHSELDEAAVSNRTSLLSELAKSADAVPFAIPAVLETRRVEGRIVNIERRLPGRQMTAVLGKSSGEARAALVRAYLDVANRLGDLRIERPWYGDLCQLHPIHAPSFREYLTRRAGRSLRGAGGGFQSVDASELAAALPEPARPEFVHLDAFPGNMLVEGEAITSVIDFGVVAIAGDRRLDPLAATAYLNSNITPTATDADRAVAREWLAAQDLEELYEPARRWVAAFWSIAVDDLRLHEWCGSVLRSARSRASGW